VNEAPNCSSTWRQRRQPRFLDDFFTINGIIPTGPTTRNRGNPVSASCGIRIGRRGAGCAHVLRPGTRSPEVGVGEERRPRATGVGGGILSSAGNLYSRAGERRSVRLHRRPRPPADLRSDRQPPGLGRRSLIRSMASQYVAVQAGYGGVAIYAPIPPTTVASKYLTRTDHRVSAWTAARCRSRQSGGAAGCRCRLRTRSAQVVHEGERLFTAYCSRCTYSDRRSRRTCAGSTRLFAPGSRTS